MKCDYCGSPFSSDKPWAKYCSSQHQNAAAYRKRKQAQSALLDSVVRNRARGDGSDETETKTVQAHEVSVQSAEPFRRRL
jgi:hypothetical protein